MKNDSEHLKVGIRVRPLLQIDLTSEGIVSISENNEIHIVDQDHFVTSTYDKIFSQYSTQESVFEFIYPSLMQTFKGFNCTIFAYGQTGSGKTFTMFGPSDSFAENFSNIALVPQNLGLVPNSISSLFSNKESRNCTYYCSFLQIYNEHLYDLLQDPGMDKNLKIRENKVYGIFVEGLAEFVTETKENCFLLLSNGDKNKAVRHTRFNQNSSRSHTIFQILIESNKVNKRGVLKKAKLNFCDLAGSEKFDKQNVMVNEHIKELTQINKSLTCLGKVIHILGTNNKNNYIPYRDSKLTRLLQDSLGINTRTILIATVSPAPQYVEETISTLKFADRAKRVMVKIKKNEISANNDQLITKLQREIHHLKTLLNLKRKGGIQELEQKIWVLTEENFKLKSIKKEISAEEVEKLKEENKKLRIELQNNGIQANFGDLYSEKRETGPAIQERYEKNDEFVGKIHTKNYLPQEDYLERSPNAQRFDQITPIKETHRKRDFEVQNTSKVCETCKSAYPCVHNMAIPISRSSKKSLSNPKSQGSFKSSPKYNSTNNSFLLHETPNHKGTEIPKNINFRYRMNNYIIDGKSTNDVQKSEAKDREMKQIKERLNKIIELETFRKEHFRIELQNLEKNRQKEEEDRRKSVDDIKKKKKTENNKQIIQKIRKNVESHYSVGYKQKSEIRTQSSLKKSTQMVDYYNIKQRLIESHNDYL